MLKAIIPALAVITKIVHIVVKKNKKVEHVGVSTLGPQKEVNADMAKPSSACKNAEKVEFQKQDANSMDSKTSTEFDISKTNESTKNSQKTDTIEIGSEIEAFGEKIEDEDGHLILSNQNADFIRSWNRIDASFEKNEIVQGTVTRRIKGGLVIDLFGVEAFLPISQMNLFLIPDVNSLIRQTLDLRIIRLNKARKYIVVSHRAALEELRNIKSESAVNSIDADENHSYAGLYTPKQKNSQTAIARTKNNLTEETPKDDLNKKIENVSYQKNLLEIKQESSVPSKNIFRMSGKEIVEMAKSMEKNMTNESRKFAIADTNKNDSCQKAPLMPKPVYCVAEKNGRYDSKYLLDLIERDERDCFKRRKPCRRPLYYLADFGDAEGYAKVIDDLALLAQDENWSFKNSIYSRKNVILDNYINQSFKRLLIEDTSNNNPENDKIKLSKKRDALLFNTGLFDHHCEPIYAMFKKIWNGFQSWKFDQFVCSETDAGLRIARDAFGRNLPKPARFYDSLENLVYNGDLEIFHDFNEHIVITNCDRLPLPFLRQYAVDFDGYKNKSELYNNLRCYLEREHNICNQIFERIKEGVEKIEKKVKTNFKIAVPIYYPRFKCITMLLPLFLQDSNKADAAIVLSKHDDYYELRTILTLQMAYKDARLIVKPDSDWLQSLNIDDDDVEDDEEITDFQGL